MRASGVYGDFLAAEDIHEPTQATIAGVDLMTFDRDGRKTAKIVLSFDDLPGRLALNKTNAETLIERLGDETDAWAGKTITLAVEPTEFRGKRVPGLRVS